MRQVGTPEKCPGIRALASFRQVPQRFKCLHAKHLHIFIQDPLGSRCIPFRGVSTYTVFKDSRAPRPSRRCPVRIAWYRSYLFLPRNALSTLAQQKPARDTDLGSIAMHTHAHKVRMRTTYGLQQTGAQDAVVVRVVTGRHHVVRIVLPTFNTRLPKKYKSLLALNSSNTESDHSFGTSLSSPVTFDAVFCFPFPFARLQVCPFALWVILWATLSESLSTLRVNLL